MGRASAGAFHRRWRHVPGRTVERRFAAWPLVVVVARFLAFGVHCLAVLGVLVPVAFDDRVAGFAMGTMRRAVSLRSVIAGCPVLQLASCSTLGVVALRSAGCGCCPVLVERGADSRGVCLVAVDQPGELLGRTSRRGRPCGDRVHLPRALEAEWGEQRVHYRQRGRSDSLGPIRVPVAADRSRIRCAKPEGYGEALQ